MRTSSRLLVACLVLASAMLAAGQGNGANLPVPNPNNMKAYPPAEEGMTRFVLQLPAEANEASMKVEIIAGKTVLVDNVNQYFFPGKITEETIEGWGFPRYNVSQLGPLAGTLMAVDRNAPKVNRFVALGSEPYLIRYNSKLPIVVYAPNGVEIQYRVWKADPKPTAVEKG